METERPYFHFAIRKAYPFRHVVTVLKQYTKNLTFKCDKNGFKIEECSNNGKMFFSASWDKNWVSVYHLEPLENLSEEEIKEEDFSLEIGVKCPEFEKETSLISKNGSFDMKMMEEDSQNIELTLDKNSGVSYVPIINSDFIDVTSPDLSSLQPFIKMGIKEFSDICKQFKKLNCSEVMIECFDKGVAFIGMTAEKAIKKCVPIGICENKTQNKGLADILDNLPKGLVLKPTSSNNLISTYPVVMDKKKTVFQISIDDFHGLNKINNLAPGADICMYYHLDENVVSVIDEEEVQGDAAILWIHFPIAYGNNYFSVFIREFFPHESE